MENDIKELSGVKVHCAFEKAVDVVDLVEHPRNPNKHGDKQIALLAKIIRNQGWRNPIVVSADSGFIVAGHGRLMAAKVLNVEQVPVDYQPFDNEAEEYAHLIADNRIAELAEADKSELAKLVRELEDKIDLDLTGFDAPSLEELLATKEESQVDAEPKTDKAAELQVKWKTEKGQLWKLGEHRLLCGDSTNAKDVERVLGDDKADIMVTDPPYGVNYDPSWRAEAGMTVNENKLGKVQNDDIADWTPAWQLFDGDVCYVYHAGAKAGTVQQSLEDSGFNIRSQIIWAKDKMALSRGDYHWQHEPCWYGVRDGKKGNRTEDRTQTTVWQIAAREDSGHGHGTQKPVECMARPIRNHHCSTVYEPFSGSGTTIIACEQLDKKCRAIEIDPNYVAVALERYVDATGKEPVLLNARD
jgi:DNA modification methylase